MGCDSDAVETVTLPVSPTSWLVTASLHRVLVAGQMHTAACTDTDGAKRIKQVITDTEIGASLRFTTVEVVRGTQEQSASPS